MEYQNIFTQVQVQGPPEMGMDPTGDIARERTNKAGFSKLAGILGNAQLGPLHLGMFGVVSLATGLSVVLYRRPELLGPGGLFSSCLHARSVLVLTRATFRRIWSWHGAFERRWLVVDFLLLLAGLRHLLVDPHLSARRRAGPWETCQLGLCLCHLAVFGSWSDPPPYDGLLVRSGALWESSRISIGQTCFH